MPNLTNSTTTATDEVLLPNRAVPSTFTAQSVPLLSLLGESLTRWQLHRCQVTDAFIRQDAPMKLIYHYEQLDEAIKADYPLRGSFLLRFDELMSRETFAQLLGLPLNQVAKPWQLKFVGKLVVFLAQPEIALRLHWCNTLKPFEPVYTSDLSNAIEAGFKHWQFIPSIEIISKNPQVVLTAEHLDLATPWQLASGQTFTVLPAPLALSMQAFFQEQDLVQDNWLTEIKTAAQTYAELWQADKS